jgi:pyruvate kinase
MVLCHLDKVE